MKRILFLGLLGALTIKQTECRAIKFIGTYYVPNSLITGPEKQESKGGQLAQPDVARVDTAKNTVLGSRTGKIFTFDLQEKTSGSVNTGNWEIKEATDSEGKKKFTMCLDRKIFLPGGLEKAKWGPKHTGNITYQDNMICFDLDYEER